MQRARKTVAGRIMIIECLAAHSWESGIIQGYTVQSQIVFAPPETTRRIEEINRSKHLFFGKGSCFDYIDSSLLIDVDKGAFGVTVFIEPCGNITRWDRTGVAIVV